MNQQQELLHDLTVGQQDTKSDAARLLHVALLTGGQDRHYASGLAMSLLAESIRLDVIGGNAENGPEMHGDVYLQFLNLHGDHQQTGVFNKILRILLTYVRHLHYAAISKAQVFHILWNNRLEHFDRTLLMLYYKLLGKKVTLTAHNVNARRRDGSDSFLNRLTLRFQYKSADHIFVHTSKMKAELVQHFGVRPSAITIVPFGVNNVVPCTDLTAHEAKRRLGIDEGDKTALLFGAIKPYKGLEYLVAAFHRLATEDPRFRLIIAGERKKESHIYLDKIQQIIERHTTRDRIIQHIKFIPDDETELYFKAADVAILPYTEIFQSGILLLAYSFGLPVIATDVGSFAEDIQEGQTGFICRPKDADDLAATMKRYFGSNLFRNLEERRKYIKDYALTIHSWAVVGALTRKVYSDLIQQPPPHSGSA